MTETFEELVDIASTRILSALLTEGGPGMKRAIHLWMAQAIQWDKQRMVREAPMRGGRK